MFEPQLGDSLVISAERYQFVEHPVSLGFVHGQGGRAGTVYHIVDPGGMDWALKVFFEAYRQEPSPSSEYMTSLATLPGLSVCQRTVLSSEEHGNLLQQYPELQHAVLMPWIGGFLWANFVASRKSLKRKESLALATGLLDLLVGLEKARIAHSDLSSSNLIILKENKLSLELVDVEQLYSPMLSQPQMLPGGSPGYTHTKAANGLWQPEADRFAGAVLLAEILGWCDKRICSAADGSAPSYFKSGEEQTDCERYHLLCKVLREKWENPVAELFAKAWGEEDISLCPSFLEWRSSAPFLLGGKDDVEPKSPVFLVDVLSDSANPAFSNNDNDSPAPQVIPGRKKDPRLYAKQLGREEMHRGIAMVVVGLFIEIIFLSIMGSIIGVGLFLALIGMIHYLQGAWKSMSADRITTSNSDIEDEHRSRS